MRPAALLLVIALMPADEITLADGRSLEGDVVSAPGAAEVVLRQRRGGMTVEQRFPAPQVVTIAYGLTEHQQRVAALTARAKALASGGTAEAWWTLAEAWKSAGETAEAKRCAQQVISREADHAAARAYLGWVRQNDTWMRPAEAAVARGEVFFRGRWVPPAERDAVLAEEERAAAEAKRRSEARLEEARREAEIAKLRQASQPAAEATSPWFINGTYAPTPRVVLLQPRVLSGPVVAPSAPTPGLQLQATGQHGTTLWHVEYQR